MQKLAALINNNITYLVQWSPQKLHIHALSVKIVIMCLMRLELYVWYRFLATEESYAHPVYKRKLIEYSETEYTNVFGRARWPGAPQRVLLTPFFSDWRSLPENEDEKNQPVIGRSIIHGVVSLSSLLSRAHAKDQILLVIAIYFSHLT